VQQETENPGWEMCVGASGNAGAERRMPGKGHRMAGDELRMTIAGLCQS
jgi:hypothetical protein